MNDFVYSSITTSACRCLLCRLTVAIYIDGLSLNLSPLRGRQDAFMFSSPKSWQRVLILIINGNSHQARKDFFI